MSRKLKIIFTLSIILNVLLMGTTGGMMIKKWQRHSWRAEISEFSPESQNIVARHMQKSRDDMKKNFENMRKARKNVKKALQAEEFDEENFERAAQVLQKSMQSMMTHKMDAMKQLSKQLSPEERAKLSMRLLKSSHGKTGHKRQRKRDHAE